MGQTYHIFEYDKIVADKNIVGCISLPEKTFNELKTFICENKSSNDETEAVEIMGYSIKKGLGEVITAKNYVGVLSLQDGTTIEILPKVYSNAENDYDASKKLLLDMLKTLKDSPYKFIQKSNLNIDTTNLFEVFIRMFLDEVILIYKHGLKSGYETIENNEGFFKGKLDFNQHIKSNFAHKERFFVQYDEFNLNRPENKLIKSTLNYLYKKTTDLRNKKDIKNLLNVFDSVDESKNYDADFSKVSTGRDMAEYGNALSWCSVFLKGKSFTSFAGSTVSYALLFPMEKLFESYIASKIKSKYQGEYNVKTQDGKYHLFDKKFLLKPDIVMTRKSDKAVFILDTKWKILVDSSIKNNYGISQSDMYQMYAYGKKYETEHICLIYPKTEQSPDEPIEFRSKLDDVVDVTVRVKFVDLHTENTDESISNLIDSFTKK